ncbi:MAG: protein kinase [Acidobacteriota bacterium]
MTIIAGSRLGPYEILAPIGAGGMGEVFRARDARLGRDVAIKVLPASFSADADRLRRFEQEARAAGILNHPNITAVLDIGEHDGAPYVVQELLQGETLRQALAGGLSPRKAIDYGIQIAHGLAAAHEKGIVHRDLKPENVFVTKDGRVKILDFGLAKLTHAEEGAQATNLPTATAGTEPGVVLGTLGYMSPEQVRGRPADARSDIFSFGAILYEMLAGQRAFKGDSAADTMSAILKEDPPDLSVTSQNVAPGLERVVRHCLEKNPEQRFQSARDLAFDLGALSGVSAPRAGVPDAAEKTGRRLPPAAAVAILLLTAAGVYFGGRRTGSRLPAGPEIRYSKLTTRHQPIFTARFAPDGKTIVFSSAPHGNESELFMVRAGTSSPVPRGIPNLQLLSVSSRGELAVLTGARYVRHNLFTGTLARLPLEGGAPREVTENVREADWSPDGSDLALIRNVGGRDRLEYPLGKVLAETGGYFSDPRVSPDGKHIAVFEHPIRFDDRGSVALIDLAGKKSTLTDAYRTVEGLVWSQDGSEVLFSGASEHGDLEIRAVDLKSRRRTALRGAGDLMIRDVAKDGRWLTTRDDKFRELLVLTPGQPLERDISWLDLSFPAALSADGRSVLFTEESPSLGNSYSTCLRGTDGSAVVRLGDGTARDLSPDGKWALAVLPTEPERLVLYPTGPGQSRTLENGNVVAYESAKFFPDGTRLLLCGHESGRAVRCYLQSVSGGPPRAITSDDRTSGFVSPDGGRIAVEGPGGLELYPAEGGAAVPVPGSTRSDGLRRWSVDGRSVLVAHGWEVPLRLERMDVASGRREFIRAIGPAELAGAVQVQPIVISADEKTYVYSCRRLHSLLFLVEGAH